MKALDDYLEARSAVFKNFNLRDTCEFGIEDMREVWWHLGSEEVEYSVRYGENREQFVKGEGDVYMPQLARGPGAKCVCESEHYTMCCVRSDFGGDKYLMILSNERRVPEEEYDGE